MAKPQFVLEKPHPVRKGALAILAGGFVLIITDQLFGGMVPFLGFVFAAIVIYIASRR